MHDDTIEPFWSPAIGRKKLTAAFDGGRLTSDGGVALLAAAERRIGIAHRLANASTVEVEQPRKRPINLCTQRSDRPTPKPN